MGNQQMFMYGLYAYLVMLGGSFVFVMSLIALLSSLLLSSWLIGIIGIILMIIGIGIMIKGKAMRFDFQRNSGSIIHRGDW